MTSEQIEDARRYLEGHLAAPPEVCVVLGSGLDIELPDAMALSYSEIPHWPQSGVAGHAGRFVAGTLVGKRVAVLAGRVHLYEGHSVQAVVGPVRVLGRLGIRTLILTNAAGGIRPEFRAGQLVLISDHINLLGTSPLVGPCFVDLSEVYPERLRRLARNVDPRIPEGVYAALPGPNYETPAEIRYLRSIGADMVGMSTVPEAIAAAQMGIPVLGVSSIANAAAGVLPGKISHEEVLAAGVRVRERLAALLKGVIGRL
jgi:purine-nucleoside phosphorylase